MTNNADKVLMVSVGTKDLQIEEIRNWLRKYKPANELTFANIHEEQHKSDVRNTKAFKAAEILLSKLDDINIKS